MMKNLSKNSTIAAIATASGTGGIGIIKISGPFSLSIIQKIFLTRNKRLLTEVISHKIYHGNIIEPSSGTVVDEVIMFAMKSPRSYTTEDVVEIQAHGGPVILKSILDIVLKNGAVIAEPGEFTKRAFLNGRIDLTQAESVIDIINSQSNLSLKLSVSQLTGRLYETITDLRDLLLEELSKIEAGIDFPDEVEDYAINDELYHFLKEKIESRLLAILENYNQFHIFKEGIKIVIVGAPNVGKSSLMNRFSEKEKSIVTEIPGTTRDIIDEQIFIKSIPIVISDTAGIHKTDDPVETIGIGRTNDYIKKANIVLFVIDVHQGITDNELNIYQNITDKNVIIVLNKIDLKDKNTDIDTSVFKNIIGCVEISAKYNQGIDRLKKMISDFFTGSDMEIPDKIIPNLRQKNALIKVIDSICSARKAIKDELPIELIAIDLKSAIRFLGEIIGENTEPDILDSIFNNFCIGK